MNDHVTRAQMIATLTLLGWESIGYTSWRNRGLGLYVAMAGNGGAITLAGRLIARGSWYHEELLAAATSRERSMDEIPLPFLRDAYAYITTVIGQETDSSQP
jgi:hypothetical protein